MTEESASTTGPLAGVVVLDLTQFLAGPNATQILADLGARVVKVEPAQGDSARDIPPHLEGDLSAYFVSVNRSKQSIVLDLKAPRGREVFLQLVAHADVVIENFRPGVATRLGLGYEDVSAANPKIIYSSITGFGSQGANAKRPAYDIIVQALSGAMGVNGEVGRPPARLGVPIGDLAAGMFAAIGILAALTDRAHTGRGAKLEVSMLQTLTSMLSYLGQYYLTAGVVAGPQGGGHLSIPTYGSFKCGDGRWVVIAANTPQMWTGLCHALDSDELTADPRFPTNTARLEHRTELEAILGQRFGTQSAAYWLDRLHDNGVPAAPINRIDQTLEAAAADEHEPGVVEVIDPARGATVRLLASPMTTSTGPTNYRFAPRLGEHTVAVLAQLAGYTEQQIETLLADGIAVQPSGSELPEDDSDLFAGSAV